MPKENGRIRYIRTSSISYFRALNIKLTKVAHHVRNARVFLKDIVCKFKAHLHIRERCSSEVSGRLSCILGRCDSQMIMEIISD